MLVCAWEGEDVPCKDCSSSFCSHVGLAKTIHTYIQMYIQTNILAYIRTYIQM